MSARSSEIDRRLKSSFAPVVDEKVRVLILGSLPGEVSLAERRYYAHPTNQFWRLTGSVIGRDLAAMDYEKRLVALIGHGIGLWDVVGRARRHGSGDGAIRDHAANPLGALVDTLPRLKAVGFNGAKAARLGRAELAGLRPDVEKIDLPSSSAAYCSITLDEKLERWQALRAWL